MVPLQVYYQNPPPPKKKKANPVLIVKAPRGPRLIIFNTMCMLGIQVGGTLRGAGVPGKAAGAQCQVPVEGSRGMISFMQARGVLFFLDVAEASGRFWV